MALLIVPSFVTNLARAVTGGYGRAVPRRIWPFLLMATPAVWPATAAFTRLESVAPFRASGRAAGGLRDVQSQRRAFYHPPAAGRSGGTTVRDRQRHPHRHDRVFRRARGDISAGCRAFPRPADSGHGVLFPASTVALVVALAGTSLLTPTLGLVSAAAVVPAAIGMVPRSARSPEPLRGALSKDLFHRHPRARRLHPHQRRRGLKGDLDPWTWGPILDPSRGHFRRRLSAFVTCDLRARWKR